MENLITGRMIEENRDKLVGRIFTQLQLNILKKKIQKRPLNRNERTYYYKYIKPKLKAMLSFFDMGEFNIQGKEYIPSQRIPRAVKILRQVSKKHRNKRMMISGSFLFNKAYNDIDVFIFTKYHKEDYTQGKVHVNFVPKSALDSLFFSSISQISVSNFVYDARKEFRIKLDGVLHDYELLVNNIINKKDYSQELRRFLLKAEYVAREVVLNPKQLYDLKKRISRRNTLGLVSNTLVNSLVCGYQKRTLRDNLRESIRDYSELLKQYKKADNIRQYIKTYRKVIDFAA